MKTLKEFLNEARVSEWEARHDEFVNAGRQATQSQINKTLEMLEVLKDIKPKFGNKIFGKKGKGQYAMANVAAAQFIRTIKKVARGKTDDEVKELGQKLIYAKSLISDWAEILTK